MGPIAGMHLLATFARRRMLNPGRPDRVIRQLFALHRWGPNLAGGYISAARRTPGLPAVVDERGTRTFAELDDRSTRLAHALAGFGRVGVLCRNHAGFLETLVGCAKGGIDTVLLNTGLSPSQVVAVAAEQQIDALVADDEFWPRLTDLPAGVTRFTAWSDDPLDQRSVDRMLARTEVVRLIPPERPGRTIILTSGTTGRPKGACRPEPPGLGPLASMLSRIPVRVGDRVLIASPLFHTWAFGAVQVCMGVRATVVLQRGYDPTAILRTLAEQRCTAMFTVPVLLQRLLDLPGGVRGLYDTRALRVVATSGSLLAGDLATRFQNEFGDVLYNLYGSTEASWASIASPADLRRAPDTAGRPPFGTRLSIVDEAGRPVPRGTPGRILVANDMLFDGYTNGTGAPSHGVVDTGDVGHLDAHGLLFVDGRVDDLVISGGENVFPAEVEQVLAALPEVREVAVIGVPDPEFGQRLAAFVVLREGRHLDADAVRQHVRTRLARWAVPRDVHFLDELPRNATGKVVPAILRQRTVS